MRFLIALLIVLPPSTLAANDLHLPTAEVKAGKILYLQKCRRCHGKDALGGNAPDIQGILVKDVIEAIEGVENMPQIPLRPGEAEQLAVYLMSLAPDQARLRLGLK